MKRERFSLPSDRPSRASYAVLLRRHWKFHVLFMLLPMAATAWRVATTGQNGWIPICLLVMGFGHCCWESLVRRTIKVNANDFHRWNDPAGYWFNFALFFGFYLVMTVAILFAPLASF